MRTSPGLRKRERTTGRYAATEPKDGVGRQGRTVLERSLFGQEPLGHQVVDVAKGALISTYSWRVIVNEKKERGHHVVDQDECTY